MKSQELKELDDGTFLNQMKMVDEVYYKPDKTIFIPRTKENLEIAEIVRKIEVHHADAPYYREALYTYLKSDFHQERINSNAVIKDIFRRIIVLHEQSLIDIRRELESEKEKTKSETEKRRFFEKEHEFIKSLLQKNEEVIKAIKDLQPKEQLKQKKEEKEGFKG